MPFANPYAAASEMRWWKGNFHTHSTESDGQMEPQAVVDAYAAMGYHVLAMTDHDQVIALDKLEHNGLLLLPGNEVTANGPHLCHIFAQSCVEPTPDRQQVLDKIIEEGAFAVLNHPNWGALFDHCPIQTLTSLKGYQGLEICNGIMQEEPGSHLALNEWDLLLSCGYRIWGLANDDSHWWSSIGQAWNMIQATECTAAAIQDALEHGRFYATTGVQFAQIGSYGCVISAEATEAVAWIISSVDGTILERSHGTRVAYQAEPEDSYPYVRLTAQNALGQYAWSQPFFYTRTA